VLEPITDFRDVGDRVVVRYFWRGLGRGPGMHLETTTVYTIREGKIFYMEYFWDDTQALEAAGLRE
jgi:ketosteroid isomerase-like protein